MYSADETKQHIIELFRSNVKGHRADVAGRNIHHDGRKGHWLEERFGIVANGDNAPDLWGYELKNETTSKTTFGDWSANVYVFTDSRYSRFFAGSAKFEKQDSFVRIFGRPNPAKNGRYSWSGIPCPKINQYNPLGQILLIRANHDIVAEYSYSMDQRPDKSVIVPRGLQLEHLAIATWYGERLPVGVRAKCLKEKLEDKFDQNGWFTCKTDANGIYDRICFGDPINWQQWLRMVNAGIVFFDSGMYEGNKRPYSQWRADNRLWNSLIVEEYR